MVDIDGNEYIDYVCALGPLILGHCPPRVVRAVREQAGLGSIFASSAVGEDVLSRMVCDCIPSVDLVSFTSSASEACHMAVRLSRAFTGKSKILKFEGGYHGWMEDLLFSIHPDKLSVMGSEDNPQPVPDSLGLSRSAISEIVIASWNRPEALEEIFRRHGHEIAGLILEPLPANNGIMPPIEGFLELLRSLTRQHEVLLIFDETITSFRIGLGGAQAHYDVMPDLTVFGKGVGGGYPIAGFGGSKEIMDLIAARKVGRFGTYNSNSLCVAASIAVLEELTEGNGAKLDDLNSVGTRLMEGLEDAFREQGFPVQVQGAGAVFSTFFTDRPVETYRDCLRIDTELYYRFWLGLLDRGIRIMCDDRGMWFLSTAHTDKDIEETVEKVKDTLEEMKKG
jgi:glutamate-1-semialdehyde 2,1-aminomutase